MQLSITNLPEDIIKNVTRENWVEYFYRYMVDEHFEYIWEPSVMRDFIKAILK